MSTMDKDPGQILVVDDNPDILTATRLLLKKHYAGVQTTTDPRQLPVLMAQAPYPLVLLDMNFSRDAASGEEGLHYLRQILASHPDTQVVMMTAYGELELAVEAMKAGAADFVTKPWDNARLLDTLAAAMAKAKQAKPKTAADPAFIGVSQAMAKVQATLAMVAPTDANVLITGESGTGKELVARALHQASRRSAAPFVGVDMGALAESLIESELFGHKKGAFTDAKADRPGRFQQAQSGTLFLDELGNLPLAQQSKLLAALQNRQIQPLGASQPLDIDIRLVCATNEDLEARVAAGDFRQDLLYRINTVTIRLPPLRERREDIPLLAAHFLAHYQDRYQRRRQALPQDLLARLSAHPWPGNVRELQHCLERLVILSGDGPLDGKLLDLTPVPEQAQETAEAQLNLGQLEQQAIEQALAQHQGNISHAAKALGLTRAALYRRLEKHGL
ncbi:sigma-54 dependent transcriptional regulator [Gallaecimonas kandeliae]|uniref:sigma-54-dependent transcriptional regulator n=1 Tax=Gallaecimonas kandeliae TaxID=3029055 RepID=UPI002648C03F|nr:sigma-54 dependent transcriptional regulator [Gallaecimonas kandeliae]WKE65492.1 sigma-54 dependent transcriptional regulator [Gallaecimonas kandeliae]